MNAPIIRFDGWTLNPRSGELERGSSRLRLQEHSLQVLLALIERPGEVVPREELIARLWPSGVVDFEMGLNTAVRRLRTALGDTADTPRYIETLPRRGYRFTGSLEPSDSAPATASWPGESVSLSFEREARTASVEKLLKGLAAEHPPRSRPAALLGGTVIAVVAAVGLTYLALGRLSVPRHSPAELTSSGVPPAIHSLVVLPLENLSGDKEQEYFADGMTDALTTDLAQIGSLRVISRTSAMQFKGSKETLPQIGRDLQVDAVVEGTVARGENRVRVTAQLVEAGTDHHLWARAYERDLKNVLALQDEIAQDITEQIRVKLTPQERSLLMQAHAVDPEAYDASLRGWYWSNKLTPEGERKALDYFQKAIAKDPGYALAYAGVADSFLKLAFTRGIPLKEAFPKAREAAVKALVLDPSLAEAHAVLATVKFHNDWDWSGAEAEHKQATTLSPNNATAHLGYSCYLVAMGRFDEAMKEIERARDLDPFSVPITWWLGQALYHARRYDDALRQDRRGLEMYPDNALFYDAIADVYEQKKMFAEAFAARQQALTLENDPNVTALAEAYKRSGYRGYLLKEAEVEQTHNPAYAAHIYALLNDEARAMTALEVCYKERCVGILFMRTAPELDSIRSSPRFRDLVRRIGFPQPSSDKN